MLESRTIALLPAILLLAGTVACRAPSPRPLLVLGAASLSEVLREIDETAPDGPQAAFSFAGSQTLAAQIRRGVRADVVALADPALVEDLHGRELAGAPRVFAANRLVWVGRATPGGPGPGPSELASGRVRLVLAAPEVPAGAYARAALAELGLLEAAEAQIVSRELDVRGVLSKLALAGADAGIAYATDLAPGRYPELAAEPLPEAVQPRIAYAAAVVARSRAPERAGRFVAGLASPRARAILRDRGFRLP